MCGWWVGVEGIVDVGKDGKGMRLDPKVVVQFRRKRRIGEGMTCKSKGRTCSSNVDFTYTQHGFNFCNYFVITLDGTDLSQQALKVKLVLNQN